MIRTTEACDNNVTRPFTTRLSQRRTVMLRHRFWAFDTNKCANTKSVIRPIIDNNGEANELTVPLTAGNPPLPPL